MKLSSDCPSGSVKTAIRNLGSAAYTGGFFLRAYGQNGGVKQNRGRTAV